MKKLLFLWLSLTTSLFALGQTDPVRLQLVTTTVSGAPITKVVPRNISIYPLTTAGNNGFLADISAGLLPIKAVPAEGSIVGRYSYNFSDSRSDYLSHPVVSDPAPVLVDGVRTAPRLVGNYYQFKPQTALNTALYKRIPAFSPHSSKIIIYPGGLYSDTTDNALTTRGWTHTSESAKWIDGSTYPTKYRRALEMANYQAAYAAASDPDATSDQTAKLLAWAGYGTGNYEGTHTFIPDEETCKLYAKYWWATFKQNDWKGAGVDYFSVNHEIWVARTSNYPPEWYNQVGWITKEIIRLAALEGVTLKSGMSDWGNITNVNPQNFEDIDGATGYPRYMSYSTIDEPFRGSSQSAPLGNSSVLGQLLKDGKAFAGTGSYIQHTIDDQSLFQKNTNGTYKVGSDGGLIWRTDKRSTTIGGQQTIIYGDDYYKSQLKFYGRFARFCTNLYFRAGGVHLPRSDVRQSGFENVRLLSQFRLDTEIESGTSPSSTGTTEAEFATLNSRPLNPDWTEMDGIAMYLFTDYLRGWMESQPKTVLGADNGKVSKSRQSVEMYTKAFHRASQLNWIFSTPWTLIQPKLWIKGTGVYGTPDLSEAFYRKPIIWGGLATKDGHPTIFLNWAWPCQDTDRYTDVTVWVDKGAGVVSPGYRIRIKGRKTGLEYWTLPDEVAGVEPKHVYFQFKSLLGEKITWRGDYREAKITAHPTPPAIVESELNNITTPGSSTTTSPGSGTVAAPSWIAGMRYSYASPLLTFEGSGDIGALKLDRLDGTPFTTINPDGVSISNGNFYGSGPLYDQAPYTKQWKINYPYGAALRVTLQQGTVSTNTFSYTVTPTNGASRIVLSSSNSSPPTSYTNVVFPGNSITHNLWDGKSWGMAASAPEKDYLHILRGRFAAVNSATQVRELADFSNPSAPYWGIGEGPHWEGNHWQLESDVVYTGGINRFNVVAASKPDLVVMRLGENVNDTINNFALHYEQFVDKLISQNTSARVVLTTTLWDSRDAKYVRVSNAIRAVGAKRGWTVVDLSGIAGSTSGDASHPNDAAMQTIADRIWAAVSTTTPTSTSASFNKPAWDTFDYTPITTNQTWPTYDERLHRGVPIGDKVILQNDSIRCEIWRNFGGSVAHISAPNSDNIVNQFDWGRGTAYTLYLGGRMRYNEARPIANEEDNPADGSRGIARNPIQIGDIFDNPVVAYRIGRSNDGKSVFTEARMLNWQVNNDPTDITIQQWTTIKNNTCPVHVKIINNATGDKTQYPARSNEFPQLIVNPPYTYNAHVDGSGSVVFTAGGGSVSQEPFQIAQNWYAMVNGTSMSSTGVGLVRPGLYTSVQPKQYAEGTSGEFYNPAVYSAADQKVTYDWNATYYARHTYVYGTTQQIKNFANATTDPLNSLAFKFNGQNGRGYFWWENAKDSGYPTPDTGLEVTVTKASDYSFWFPAFSLDASAVPSVYVRYKASAGYPTTGQVYVGKVGQTPIQVAAQSSTYSLTVDNAWHTVQIPVGTVVGSSGRLSNIHLGATGAPIGAKITIAWINTVDAEP